MARYCSCWFPVMKLSFFFFVLGTKVRCENVLFLGIFFWGGEFLKN